MKVEIIMQHLIGKTYPEIVSQLTIEADDGDCCGYANVEVEDYIKELENADKAILVNVIKIDYNEEGDEGERVVANFVFDLDGKLGIILGYELSAGSGSGWSYGAYCTLKYQGEEVACAAW